MTAALPRCAICRVGIEPGQNVVFRPDGRVQHAACPEVLCPVCGGPIRPADPIRRDGEVLLHGNCWMRRARAAAAAFDAKPPVKVMPTERDGIVSLVRAKLLTGTLPRGEVQKVWVSLGTGRDCSACDQPITAAEIEHEADLVAGSTLRLHRNCLGVWQAEVARYGREIAGGSAATP
jgi:hypothetical protein